MTWLAVLNWARKNWLAIAIALAALSLYLVGYSNGKQSQKAETAQVQAEYDAYKKTVQEAAQRQRASNLAKEESDRKAFQQIAEQHAKEIEDAKAKADRIAADLRAGNIKLRKHWRGCATPQAADRSSGIDEEAELRVQGAAEDVRDGAEADGWIEGLQKVVEQLQKQQELIAQ